MPRSFALAALLLAGAAPRALDAGPANPGGSQAPSPWRSLWTGVEAAAASDLGGDPSWRARVVAIDPRSAILAVQFDADRPTIAQWRTRFPGAIAIVNGSFYSTDGLGGKVRPTCDLVLAGKLERGAGCRRQDALFFGSQPGSARRPPPAAAPAPSSARPAGAASSAAVPRDAPDAGVGGPLPGCPAGAGATPRLMGPAEFEAAEWTEAVKSFPALVRRCQPACPGPHYCQERSRTAALAQLRDGRILLFASQGPAIRREVGRFLANALGAVDAINLDGGPEATLALRGEALEDSIGVAGTGLPLVLVVLPRTR